MIELLSLVATGLFLLVWVFPIVWTLLSSLKTARDIFVFPPTVLFEPYLGNYEQVLWGRRALLSDLATSGVIATATTAIAMLVGVPMAYAFARLQVPFKRALAFYTLFIYLVPRIGLVIPHFVILRSLNLMDTHLGLIIVYLSFTLPLAIWLMVTYFEDVAPEMEEAALMDRASRFQALWHVVLPQVRGGMAVATIFVFITAWNEFLFAVVLSGNNARPVTVAMYNFISVEQTLWGPLTAAAIIAMLPVVALGLAAQKEIVKGMSAGSVKA